MAKIEKLRQKLLSNPKDFTWDELTTLLGHYGYNELKPKKTGGSRRKFSSMSNHVIDLHKPHPGKILKSYQVKQIVATLKERGFIKDE
jgi:hypothetical protein